MSFGYGRGSGTFVDDVYGTLAARVGRVLQLVSRGRGRHSTSGIVLQVRRHYRSILVTVVRGGGGGGGREVMQPRVAETGRVVVMVQVTGVLGTAASKVLAVRVALMVQLLLQQLLHPVIARTSHRSSGRHHCSTLGRVSGRLTVIGLGRPQVSGRLFGMTLVVPDQHFDRHPLGRRTATPAGRHLQLLALGLVPPVLEPYLDLSLGQLQRVGQISAFRARQVSLLVEPPFQLEHLRRTVKITIFIVIV